MAVPERSLLQSKVPQVGAERIVTGPKGGILVGGGARTLAVTTIATIYDASTEKYEAELIQIQNLGTVPIYYRYDDDVDFDGPALSGSIAGGVANYDGLGSILTISDIKLRKLTIGNPSGATAAIYSSLVFSNSSKMNMKLS